jgi:hypothetical protein
MTAKMWLRHFKIGAYGNDADLRYKIPMIVSAVALPGAVIGPIWSMFSAEKWSVVTTPIGRTDVQCRSFRPPCWFCRAR